MKDKDLSRICVGMNTIKWFLRIGSVFAAVAMTFAAELAVSPITMIEEAALTTTSPSTRVDGSVGTSGTNGVFVWNKAVGDGTTNLFLSRLNELGRPVGAPRLIASEGYVSANADVYSADAGFFIRFFEMTSQPGPWRLLATRIDLDGKAAFAPIVVTTNNYKKSDSTSSGRTLLMIVENYRPTGIKLDYTILGWNGDIKATGSLEGAAGNHSFATASDGKDFLAVWSASTAPYLRVTHFSGTDGLLSTTGLGGNAMSVQVMAHGKHGYLVAGGSSLLHLSDDGDLLQKTTNPSIAVSQQDVLYPEDEGWILFSLNSSGTLQSFLITPSLAGLQVQSDPYPPTRDITAFPPSLATTVAPFGPGRFLVARTNGVSVLTSSGVSPAANAPVHADQKDSVIVASLSGYLTTWIEHHDLGYSIRGLRFATDGSALDKQSFEIGSYSSSRVRPVSVVFDGQDYVVEWSLIEAPIYLARVSPQGAPNVRSQSISIDPGVTGIYLIAQKGDLFACRGADTLTVPDVHLWKIAADGQAGPEVVVHGYGAFSDGSNLFAMGVESRSALYKIEIDPAAPNPEFSSNTIASAVDAKMVGLRRGFVTQWFDADGNSSFAYFSNGQEKVRAAAPNNVTLSFADSEERLLMIATPPTGGVSTFTSFNLQTSEQTSSAADLGNVKAVHSAGSSVDFLAIAEFQYPESQRVGKFWITTATAPTLLAPRFSSSNFTTTLGLNSNRHYRIEVSSDLINWDLAQTLTGLTNVDFSISESSQRFVRAILVPE